MDFHPIDGKHYEIGITDVASTAPASTPKYPFYMAYDEKGLHTAVIICENKEGTIDGRAFPLRKDAVQATGGSYGVQFKAEYPAYMELSNTWRLACPPLRKAMKMSTKSKKMMGEFDHSMVEGLCTFLKKRDGKFAPPVKITTDGLGGLSQKDKQNLAISNHVRIRAASNILGFFYRDMKAATDPELVAIANKFPFRLREPSPKLNDSSALYSTSFTTAHRYGMYVFLCIGGKYAEQMCRVFPVIAQLAVFDKDIAKMVIDGCQIKEIITAVNAKYRSLELTTSAKSIRPQLVGKLFDDPRRFTEAPKALVPKNTDSLMQQRLKFDVVSIVSRSYPNYKLEGNFPAVLARVIERWGNKRTLPLLGGRYDMAAFLQHTLDWARRPEAGDIDKHMSPEKLAEKIDEWDAALADAAARRIVFTGSDVVFPPAWIPDQEFTAKKKAYKFLYIRSKSELHDEGIAMSHCVSGYADKVINGRSQIYSVRNANGKRIATAEIKMCLTRTIADHMMNPDDPERLRSPVKFTIEQIRGKCNSEILPEIKAGAHRLVNKHNAMLNKEHKKKMTATTLAATVGA